MKERPILMSAPMVRAILDESKSQTRRIVKPQPDSAHISIGYREFGNPHALAVKDGMFKIPCPYGNPGGQLWLRETYYQSGYWVRNGKTKLGNPKWKFGPVGDPFFDEMANVRKSRDRKNPGLVNFYKRLGRFMPRKYSRITLEIVSVRVERLQEISEGDAKAEGCKYPAAGPNSCYRMAYKELWESINGPGSWAANPWVWVVEFKRIKP